MNRHQDRRGFTMTEIVVAVAILLVLGGAALPVTAKVMRAGKVSATKQELAGLARALRAYGTDYGYEPSRLKWGRFPPEHIGQGAYASVLGNELEADVDGVGWNLAERRGWSGPYIQGADERVQADGRDAAQTVRSYQVDAWGRYYLYRNQGETGPERIVTLTSGGPDRDLSTAADNLEIQVFRGPTW